MSITAIRSGAPTRQVRQTNIGAVVEEGPLCARLARALEAAGLSLLDCAPTATELAAATSGLGVAILYESGNRHALFDSVKSARKELPANVPLVVIWPTSNASDARGALRAGADGLVSEANLEATLAATIAAVLSGLVCIPRPMRAPLESESLSMREKQVLGMLVMGFTNAEIAAKLFLAESTVKSHLSSAYAKLGVRSRKDAANLILDPVEGLGTGILAISAA
jgi:DNA-binding NarL/FixJ family response regulator